MKRYMAQQAALGYTCKYWRNTTESQSKAQQKQNTGIEVVTEITAKIIHCEKDISLGGK